MLWPERPPDGTKIREMMDTFYRSEPVHIHEHIMGETHSSSCPPDGAPSCFVGVPESDDDVFYGC